jgi:uncharacterized protein YqgC (DUF456 family)
VLDTVLFVLDILLLCVFGWAVGFVARAYAARRTGEALAGSVFGLLIGLCLSTSPWMVVVCLVVFGTTCLLQRSGR